MKQILLFLSVLALTFNVWATDFTVNGVAYTITDAANRKVAVGTGTALTSAIDIATSGTFIIPSSVNYGGTNFSVTSISNSAFKNCKELTSVVIPPSIKLIENSAFMYCTKLKSVTIPSSVTSIEDYAFMQCSALTTINVHNTNPSTITMGTFVFSGVPSGCNVFVPAGSKAAYQAANQWKNFIIVEHPLLLQDTEVNIGSTAGSSATAKVYATIGWTASSDQNWLTVNPASATGNGTITFTVANTNPTMATRSATVTLSAAGNSNQTIAVTQAAGPATLSLSANTVNVGGEDNRTATVSVTSNTLWGAFCDQTWLTVDAPLPPTNNGILTLTATINPNLTPRSATVTVTTTSATGSVSQVIAVTQVAGPARFDVTPSKASIGHALNSKAKFNVSSNGNWSISIDQAWLTASPSSGSGDGIVTLTANENPGSTERTATVTVSADGFPSKMVAITQVIPDNALNFDGNDDEVLLNDNDGSITNAFTIETWFYWTEEASTLINFICGKGIEQMELQTGANPGTLRFIPTPGVFLDAPPVLSLEKWTHVACVYDAVNAIAKMYINGKEVALVNNGSKPVGTALINTPTTFCIGRRSNDTYHFDGSLDEFRLWNTARTESEIVSNLLSSIATPLSEPGLIGYYKFNQGVANQDNRTLSAILNDASVTGTYGELRNFLRFNSSSNWVPGYNTPNPATILNLSTTAIGIGADSESKAMFDITSNTVWKVNSDQAWLSVSSIVGSANGEITLTADANPTVQGRTATVTVIGLGIQSQTITVTQAGIVAFVNLSAATASIGATVNSTATVDVTSNTDWTVSSNQTWLTANPASASGNGTITLAATENLSTTIRTANITVSAVGVVDQIVTVTQPAGTFFYTIAASVYPVNYGVVTGTGSFNQGANVSLTATPSAGYAFVNWTENGTEVSSAATYSFTVSENRALVANFKLATGINDVTETSTINVFPNPVESELTIEIKDNKRNLFFEIMNIGGQVVYNGTVVDKVAVPMSSFTPGVYILKIKNDQKVEIRQIVKR
jgi:hypothetical protein